MNAVSLAAAALIGLAATATAAPPPQALSPKAQAALSGRTAGTPVSCISLPRSGGSSIVDETAVIYKENRHRWWVNAPAGGRCTGLRPGRAIITRTPGTQLCSGDLAFVADLVSRFQYGACALGPFVPYTK